MLIKNFLVTNKHQIFLILLYALFLWLPICSGSSTLVVRLAFLTYNPTVLLLLPLSWNQNCRLSHV